MPKNAILGAIATLALAAAAYLLFSGFGRQKALADRFESHAICLDTKQECVIEHTSTDAPPWKSPHSDKNSAYPWYFCFRCQRRFVPKLQRDAEGVMRLPAFPSCPACGSMSFGSFNPDDPIMAERKADAKLPNWTP